MADYQASHYSLFEGLQSYFKQTLIYFEVTLIMPVMSFFKENITPPESNSSAEISILFWHFNRIYRYFSRNVSFYSEQYSLLFRTMYSIIPNNTTYCSEQCKYTYDIIPQNTVPFPQIIKSTLTSCGKLWYFARNHRLFARNIDISLEILDFSLELIPQLLVIWQAAFQFRFPPKTQKLVKYD